jgi:hypothetical protein
VPLANGNPLHVQEIALQWLEKGSVREAPGSLRTLTEARLGGLSESARTLLQMLALLGAPASYDWCLHTQLLSAREAAGATEELSITGFCRANRGKLALRHSVIEEIVLENISPAAQPILHRAIAFAFEKIALPTNDVSALWEAGQHWAKAGCDSSAFNAILGCASHLLHLGLPMQALSLHELAQPLARSDEELAALASNRALAHAQNDQWASVISTLQGYRSERVRRPDSLSGQALLRLLEGRWRQHEDVTPVLVDALALARSALYPPTIRLKSATLALILADNRDGVLDEYASCEEVINGLLRDPAATQLEGLRHLMIRHAIRLRPVEAASTALELLQLVQSTARPFDCTPSRQAAYALRMGGRLADAERALIFALELARRDQAEMAELNCISSLASIALYKSDATEARQWCALALESGGFQQNAASEHALNFTRAQIAASDRDFETLNQLASALGQPGDSVHNARRLSAIVAVQLRARLHASSHLDHTSRDLLRMSLDMITAHAHRGTADFLVSTCYRALLLEGQSRAARDLLTDYLSRRRLERCALHVDLNELVRCEGLHDTLTNRARDIVPSCSTSFPGNPE